MNAAETLLNWLYCGDYECPYPTEATTTGKGEKAVEPSDRPGLSFAPRIDSSVTRPTKVQATGGKTKMAATPFKRLEDLHWHGSRALGKLSQAKEFDKWAGHRRWSLDRLDYEDTFMTHAEMYVMACEYMLDELKNMAWQRLRLVLITIGTPKPMSAVIGNMISLARYVYQETGKVGEEDEPLRELIVTFAGLYFTKFEGPEFQELIMSSSIGDREFLHDLMMKVMAKVAHLEGNGLSHLTVTQDDNWAIPNIHSVMGIEDL